LGIHAESSVLGVTETRLALAVRLRAKVYSRDGRLAQSEM
jgi:hypothetical protein